MEVGKQSAMYPPLWCLNEWSDFNFDENFREILSCSNYLVVKWEDILYNLFNSNTIMDRHIMEGVKLHMMACAMEMYEDRSTFRPVPYFSLFICHRDTSMTSVGFMNNHLLPVGDTRGLDEEEMNLLAFTLAVKLKVVRPLCVSTRRFIAYSGPHHP